MMSLPIFLPFNPKLRADEAAHPHQKTSPALSDLILFQAGQQANDRVLCLMLPGGEISGKRLSLWDGMKAAIEFGKGNLFCCY
ncbi:MAG: hypothetical protein E2598_07280 [Sphingobium sp.]|nr:hypothetical protein [Sphingobium sp.]